MTGIAPYVKKYIEETKGALLEGYLTEGISKIVPVLIKARKASRSIFFFGNGGSASTASHFVVDIGKATSHGDKRRFRCIALVDNVESVTAWANDMEYPASFRNNWSDWRSAGMSQLRSREAAIRPTCCARSKPPTCSA